MYHKVKTALYSLSFVGLIALSGLASGSSDYPPPTAGAEHGVCHNTDVLYTCCFNPGGPSDPRWDSSLWVPYSDSQIGDADQISCRQASAGNGQKRNNCQTTTPFFKNSGQNCDKIVIQSSN